MVKQVLARASRDLRGSHTVVHDSGARVRAPNGRPMRRRVSRHDVEWKDVEPALNKPARPWDRPMPRPMGRGRTAKRRGRTHGRSMKRTVRSKRTR